MNNDKITLNEQELSSISGGDSITVGTFGGAVLAGALVGSTAGPVGTLVGMGGAALGFGIGCAINAIW